MQRNPAILIRSRFGRCAELAGVPMSDAKPQGGAAKPTAPAKSASSANPTPGHKPDKPPASKGSNPKGGNVNKGKHGGSSGKSSGDNLGKGSGLPAAINAKEFVPSGSTSSKGGTGSTAGAFQGFQTLSNKAQPFVPQSSSGEQSRPLFLEQGLVGITYWVLPHCGT